MLRCFALDLTASGTARLTGGISLRSANTIYIKLRQRIAGFCEQQSPFTGEVEVDESYFSLKRVRGTGTKLLSLAWPLACSDATDVGYAKHFRVAHSANEFANASSHINGIESFWAYAKLRLSARKGIRKEMFYLHLKETEFRFNHRRDSLYHVLLKLLREKPLNRLTS